MSFDDRYKQLAESLPDEFPFVMDFGNDLCIDGHFTREDLLLLADRILRIFGEKDATE